jgi:hypothetical protein
MTGKSTGAFSAFRNFSFSAPFLTASAHWTFALINGPNAWSDQLKEMSIGVAEIEARTAPGPGEAALNGNAQPSEAFPPRRQTLRGNAEANVRCATCAMRWNGSEGQDRAMRVTAANEEKQHLPSANVESTEALVRLHEGVTKKARIKLSRSVQVRNVEAGLEYGAREESLLLNRSLRSRLEGSV